MGKEIFPRDSIPLTTSSELPLLKNPDKKVDIGPGTLLWEYGGDWRIGYTGPAAGLMQLLHPTIGAAVNSKHSNFLEDPWGRIFRSLPEILGSIYDPDAEETGLRIRNYHTGIKGQDENGRNYHALNPEAFWWAHATFHVMVEDSIDRFDKRKLSPEDREDLYKQTNEWYSRYNVRTDKMPETYKSFQEKWENVCANDLELTPAAKIIIGQLNDRTVEPIQQIPKWLWRSGLRIPTNEFFRLTAIGGLPNDVRLKFKIPWSRFDQTRLDSIEELVKLSWPLVPKRFRYHERAKAGMEARQQQAA